MSDLILVTGANRGIGLEFVRQYLADGAQVIATCRNPDRADALAALAEESGGRLEIIRLDVTDDNAPSNLAAHVGGRPLKIMINNAGVYGPRGAGLGRLTPGDWLDVFATNSVAPVVLAQALLANLKAAEAAVLVGITSRMGSIEDNSSGGSYIYRSSKAALNAALRSASIDLAESGIGVLILHPGWVETDMGGPNALIDAQTSVAGMRKVIAETDMQDSGAFFSYDGSRIGW